MVYSVLVLSSIQIIVWSLYALVIYLSHRDPSLFEYILMMLFIYLGYLFGVFLRNPKKLSVWLSLLGACFYILIHRM